MNEGDCEHLNNIEPHNDFNKDNSELKRSELLTLLENKKKEKEFELITENKFIKEKHLLNKRENKNTTNKKDDGCKVCWETTNDVPGLLEAYEGYMIENANNYYDISSLNNNLLKDNYSVINDVYVFYY